MTDSLTLAEAVPLGTVYLQRLLEDAGVRSLVIKGPAFVVLGVRRPRQSNDVDLLIHPDDRARTACVLESANWMSISYRLPAALDAFAYSKTYRHPLFPASVDVHHAFLGLLRWPAAFEEMWDRRSAVEIAHAAVVTPSKEDALVVEALNAMKSKRPRDWPLAVEKVVAGSSDVDVARLEEATISLGASESVATLITAVGGTPVPEPTTPGYRRWVSEAGGDRRRLLLRHMILRAPWALPSFVWQQITLSRAQAQFWADAHRVEFRSRGQILLLRAKKLIGL
ncbi:nucleotidyltransferase family protein [Janibacter alittae]|uniref:Nucleotidyltransferase family protein n=1 Tax=Janibacter alittae TaxID=3115209 RepID=A0ABZ2MJH9_9MICO